MNDDAPYEMIMHLSAFWESIRPGYTTLLSRDLGFHLPLSLAKLLSSYDESNGWNWLEQPVKYMRFFMPEIPNITVSDESRSFVSSLTNITRDASQIESQTMKEIDADEYEDEIWLAYVEP